MKRFKREKISRCYTPFDSKENVYRLFQKTVHKAFKRKYKKFPKIKNKMYKNVKVVIYWNRTWKYSFSKFSEFSIKRLCNQLE